MPEWSETDTVGSCLKRWLHGPTGVELFVDETGSDTYGVYIRPTDEGPIDIISIGDPDTGLFREFEAAPTAIDWASRWKAEETAITDLVPVDSETQSE